ncbi:FimV/HubP family polar landmark protein [Pusillimonas sp.]|uniref:FimV/HubP family polar landmark protein n=1 Tax=Pusillimonas sp. TaxID=3040095 RepID=UPI0037CA88DA
MEKSCCAAPGLPIVRITPVALALAAMLAMGSPADAASIGHSRLVSAPGQPLHINVPIRQLSDAEQQSLRVSAAPLAAWQQAGLTPPVELSSLQVSVEKGFSPDSRLVQVRSNQSFNGVVADLLLQITTAAGSQQHQVSLLTSASSPVPAVAGQADAGGASLSTGVPGAPAPSGSIPVRRGDTLFALALANAVDGVSVYQMMVALQKANPQAFIDGNINLVKAGATLSIPDAAALRAVSDREARRIFQQHAQAFAAYRQGVAGQRGEAVTGGSTQSGTVSSAPATVSATPAAARGDQVVLSSGGADDARDDQRDATQRNIAESETRVSQLERNVQSLNQALQMQGEAAKDAVLEGAAAVSQTLSEAATSIGMGSEEPAAAEGASESGQAGAESSGASSANRPGDSTTVTESSQRDAGLSGAPDPSAPGAEPGQSGGALSSGTGASTDGAGVASPGQSGQAASAQQGSSPAGSDGGTQAGSAGAGGPTGIAQSAGPSGTAQPGASPAAEESTLSSSSKAEQPVSWLQQNLLGVITAILALVVLIIAWVLRRASASRGGEGQGVVTEAMVQERLEKIDLDLSSSPNDGRPPHSG